MKFKTWQKLVLVCLICSGLVTLVAKLYFSGAVQGSLT